MKHPQNLGFLARFDQCAIAVAVVHLPDHLVGLQVARIHHLHHFRLMLLLHFRRANGHLVDQLALVLDDEADGLAVPYLDFLQVELCVLGNDDDRSADILRVAGHIVTHVPALSRHVRVVPLTMNLGPRAGLCHGRRHCEIARGEECGGQSCRFSIVGSFHLMLPSMLKMYFRCNWLA